MDAALAGGLVSAGVTLLALIIHKARCIARCKGENDSSDSDGTPTWSCAVGFTESRLEPNRQLETVEVPENAVLYRRKQT